MAAQESRGSLSERRAAPEATSGAQSSANAPSANEGTGPDEGGSAVILESEAERILENAKKRLSVCSLQSGSFGNVVG
jgi:hypothetical protein